MSAVKKMTALKHMKKKSSSWLLHHFKDRILKKMRKKSNRISRKQLGFMKHIVLRSIKPSLQPNGMKSFPKKIFLQQFSRNFTPWQPRNFWKKHMLSIVLFRHGKKHGGVLMIFLKMTGMIRTNCTISVSLLNKWIIGAKMPPAWYLIFRRPILPIL